MLCKFLSQFIYFHRKRFVSVAILIISNSKGQELNYIRNFMTEGGVAKTFWILLFRNCDFCFFVIAFLCIFAIAIFYGFCKRDNYGFG